MLYWLHTLPLETQKIVFFRFDFSTIFSLTMPKTAIPLCFPIQQDRPASFDNKKLTNSFFFEIEKFHDVTIRDFSDFRKKNFLLETNLN